MFLQFGPIRIGMVTVLVCAAAGCVKVKSNNEIICQRSDWIAEAKDALGEGYYNERFTRNQAEAMMGIAPDLRCTTLEVYTMSKENLARQGIRGPEFEEDWKIIVEDVARRREESLAKVWQECRQWKLSIYVLDHPGYGYVITSGLIPTYTYVPNAITLCYLVFDDKGLLAIGFTAWELTKQDIKEVGSGRPP